MEGSSDGMDCDRLVSDSTSNGDRPELNIWSAKRNKMVLSGGQRETDEIRQGMRVGLTREILHVRHEAGSDSAREHADAGERRVLREGLALDAHRVGQQAVLHQRNDHVQLEHDVLLHRLCVRLQPRPQRTDRTPGVSNQTTGHERL